MPKFAALLVALLLSAGSAWPQATDSQLAAITARGRMMEEYDVASWHATDVVLALKPKKGAVKHYIARKTDAGWVVVFGRLNETRDAFLVPYEATQGSDPKTFTVKTYDPPKRDTGFFLVAAKAIDLALQNSELEKRAYNTYVLPADAGQMYLYVLPAQTVADIYPLGGDTRLLISADGDTIVETRRMHKTILELKNPSPSDSKIVAGVHSHVLSDIPEDSDVFHVLTQTHPVPEMIGTENARYTVQVDGTITRTK